MDKDLQQRIEQNRREARIRRDEKRLKNQITNSHPSMDFFKTGSLCTFSLLSNNQNIADGIRLFLEFFSGEELDQLEQTVLAARVSGLNGQLRSESIVQTKYRDMVLFGHHYQYYKTEALKKGVWNGLTVDPIPGWLAKIIDKIMTLGIYEKPEDRPDAVIINYYPIGGSIPPHRDHPDFERPILSMRLVNECDISFGGSKDESASRNVESKGIKYKIHLPRGSLLVMGGFVGWGISHSIEACDVKKPTISITFRKVKPKSHPKGPLKRENLITNHFIVQTKKQKTECCK